jgi:transposase-like protein
MKSNKLTFKISEIEKLDRNLIKDIKLEIEKLDSKKRVSKFLHEKVTIDCPHCSSNHCVKNGIKHDMQRFKCRSCNKSFNLLTGTPLARLRKKGRWEEYSVCMTKAYSLKKCAEIVGIHPSTSFRWRHRFLINAQELKPKSLNGITEAYDSFFYYSEKGKRNPSAISTEVIGKKAHKVFVQFIRDRYNKTSDFIIGDRLVENVNTEFIKTIDKDVLFCSEKSDFYVELSKSHELRHGTLDLKRGEYMKKQIVHLKNVISYENRLRDWMYRFRGVATKYLMNYLAWFRELDEYKMKIPSKVILSRARDLKRYPYHPLTL